MTGDLGTGYEDAVPRELAYSDSQRIDAAHDNMTLVIPPAPVGPTGVLSRCPEVGERRLYDVRVDAPVEYLDGDHRRSVQVSMWATWNLVVVEASARSYELVADLAVKSLSVDDPGLDHEVEDVTAELGRPYSLVVSASGYPSNVFAIVHRHPIADLLFACCIGALTGMRASIDATVRLALTSFGCAAR